MSADKKKLSKRTKAAAILILLIIPLTIALGVWYYLSSDYHFTGRIVYLISAAVIVETMLPFVLIFEGRKPQAREMVVIAVLTAIAVAGRAAFYMLPQFKPVCAIVIITAVCFGGESGFMVGALSAFVSNFFFGQGLWTPFQMFSFGIIGFLAGVLFQTRRISNRRWRLIIYGGLSTFFIYGALVDLSTVVSSLNEISIPAVLSIYAAGIPFNLIHAIATMFFLFVLADPMIEKLERIKIKYGLLKTNDFEYDTKTGKPVEINPSLSAEGIGND